jgi:hypothetical protein
MPREIKLDGGEITILKAIGLSGTTLPGKQLIERVDDMAQAEFLDTLEGLLSLGYLMASRVNIRTLEDVERAMFRVNPTYARDLRDAVFPSKRRERERERRQRRG